MLIDDIDIVPGMWTRLAESFVANVDLGQEPPSRTMTPVFVSFTSQPRSDCIERSSKPAYTRALSPSNYRLQPSRSTPTLLRDACIAGCDSGVRARADAHPSSRFVALNLRSNPRSENRQSPFVLPDIRQSQTFKHVFAPCLNQLDLLTVPAFLCSSP